MSEIRGVRGPEFTFEALREIREAQLAEFWKMNWFEKVMYLFSQVADVITRVTVVASIGDVLLSATSGSLSSLINTRIGQSAVKILGPIDTVYEQLKKEELRIKGILDTVEIQQSIRYMRTLHRLGMIVSPNYRRWIESFNDQIRDISRSVFGEVSTLRSGLVLLQMATEDLAAMRGDSVNIGENQYYKSALDLTSHVELNARRYSRNPDYFWQNLNTLFVNPLYEERRAIQREKDGRLDRVNNLLQGTSTGLNTLLFRYDEYRRELDPFLADEKLRELDLMRRNYKRDVIDPINELSFFVDAEFPIVESQVQDNKDLIDINAKTLSGVAEIVQDPDLLDDAGRERQNRRLSSIFAQYLSGPTNTAEAIESNLRDLESIYKGLERNE